MASKKTHYVCSECGYESAKWYGRCPACNNWNCLVEESRVPQIPSALGGRTSLAVPAARAVPVGELSFSDEQRFGTGLSEFDRVLGGGLVGGSVVLIGGDPGIGKSTLLLQVCEYLGRGSRVLYISGEESPNQIKLRARRLGVASQNLLILTETDIDNILSAVEQEKPEIVIVDSIQTVHNEALSSIPGSVAQIRECTQRLTQVAKTRGIAFFLVGHVNKEGSIAGPKVLEHMVDAVLYFEGDNNLTYRILRAAKNRFGSTNEIGIFEMAENGLAEVENPSLMLLSGKPKNVSGTCAVSVMEGTRPIFAEVQALVAGVSYGNPRRTTSGVDYNRAAMLLAVLEKRAGYKLSACDAYINVIGGLRLTEPSSDLAVVLAVASSYKDVPIDDGLVAVGEVGLAGELRSVRGAESRILEAKRLGFARFILPWHSRPQKAIPGIELFPVKNIVEAINVILP